MQSEYLYDFKFQPQPDLRRLVDCLSLFSKDGTNVKIDDVAKGVKEIGSVALDGEALSQLKKDMDANGKGGGNLDVQKFAKMIL